MRSIVLRVWMLFGIFAKCCIHKFLTQKRKSWNLTWQTFLIWCSLELYKILQQTLSFWKSFTKLSKIKIHCCLDLTQVFFFISFAHFRGDIDSSLQKLFSFVCETFLVPRTAACIHWFSCQPPMQCKIRKKSQTEKSSKSDFLPKKIIRTQVQKKSIGTDFWSFRFFRKTNCQKLSVQLSCFSETMVPGFRNRLFQVSRTYHPGIIYKLLILLT